LQALNTAALTNNSRRFFFFHSRSVEALFVASCVRNGEL